MEKLEDTWAFEVCGATASAVEMTAYGTRYAILIYLAYVHEEVTVLGTLVIPLFKYLGNLGVMGSEASGAKEPKGGGVA